MLEKKHFSMQVQHRLCRMFFCQDKMFSKKTAGEKAVFSHVYFPEKITLNRLSYPTTWFSFKQILGSTQMEMRIITAAVAPKL